MDVSEDINVPLVMRSWLQQHGVDCEAAAFRVVLDGTQAHVTALVDGQQVKRRLPFLLNVRDAEPPPPAVAKKKAASRRT